MSGPATCCDGPGLFRYTPSGTVVCCMHASVWRCSDCNLTIDQCAIAGCGHWVCLNPMLALALQLEQTDDPQTLH